MKSKQQVTVWDLIRLVPEQYRNLPIVIDEHMDSNPISAELCISMDPEQCCVILKDED